MKKFWLVIFVAVTAVGVYGGNIASPKHPAVYIAGFTDAAGSRTWDNVELAVRDLLVSTVAGEGRVRIVDREKLDIILREHELTLQGMADASVSARIGKLLGADRIITGRLIIQDENLTVLAHIVDVPTAVIQATCRAQGRIADLLDVVIMLAGEISRELEIPFDPGAITEIDKKPVCSLNFLRGLGFFYTKEYDRAIMDFMISGDLDPDNLERHYWMARCYMELGEYEHARVELWHLLKSANNPDYLRDARQLLDRCEQEARQAGGEAEW